MFRRLKFLIKKKNRADDASASIFVGADINHKIPERRRYDWLESSFISDPSNASAIGNKNYLGRSLSGRRLIVFFIIIIVGLVLLLGRALYLQVWKGDYYLSVAERNRIRIYHLPAPRGIIYDRNGVPLVKNVPDFSVFIIPADFQSSAEVRQRNIDWLRKNIVDPALGDSLNKILAVAPSAREYYEPMLLIDNIDYQRAMLLQIESVDYPGISVETAAQREYLTTYNGQSVSSLAHVIGYVGRINQAEYAVESDNGYLPNDYIGKSGVEASFETQLRGKYGREQLEVDAGGRAKKIIARENVQKGDNLYLSIDVNMQAKLEGLIRSRLVAANKSRAAGIVLDPKTGQVLALVSYPSFDNNLFSKGVSAKDFSSLINDPNDPLLSRAISGEYQSGSIFKPVMAAAALQEGIISEFTTFLSTGGLHIGEWDFPDWKAGGHGLTNVRKALADSVNTFFYIIGGGYNNFKGLGVDKIKEYAEKFGLNKVTGIDLPNEKTGFIPTAQWKQTTKKEQWYIGDTYHESIGQGDVLVTPIQVARYAACFAADGRLLKPQILSKYYDQAAGKEILVATQVDNENFISQANLLIVEQGLRQAVTMGTAKILNGLPVTSAAKTGTAQWQADKSPHSWFIAFAPYDNAEIAIAVLVEEGGEGTAMAAPISFDFMNWYFRNYRKQDKLKQ